MKKKFISFEGGEGSGKTTQIKLLSEYLSNQGISNLTTREPGGSLGAEMIREMLVKGIKPWDGISEALLLLTSRYHHVKDTIRPALELGKVIICDRYQDSTLAYQGFGHGVELSLLVSLYNQIIGDFVPDLTFFIDVPVEVGINRALKRNDLENRYEKMDIDFHHRVYEGYKNLINKEKSRWIVIDGTKTKEEIHKQICLGIK